MKCMYCGGEMVQGYSPYHYDKENIHIILDKIPAWVCSQCNEVYFEEKEVESIQDFISTVHEGAHKLNLIA
jgi:YgiT-type zinc finger domain-containing protein